MILFSKGGLHPAHPSKPSNGSYCLILFSYISKQINDKRHKSDTATSLVGENGNFMTHVSQPQLFAMCYYIVIISDTLVKLEYVLMLSIGSIETTSMSQRDHMHFTDLLHYSTYVKEI